MSDELATFDDRLTMRHTRVFPHPIELVWEAVSEGEHLETWLLPVSRVEPRLGGAFVFTWGSPEGTEGQSTGTIDEFDPPRSIRYRSDDGYLQFTLEPVDDGTRLHFIQNFAPGTGLEPQEYPGSDQPAGPDSPWRPGFCAGFHNFLDALGEFLAGKITYEQQRPFIEAVHTGEFTGDFPPHVSRESEAALIDRYRAHIAATCPPD
jgi:uncharacterized protein YndB with AHSA1/START domain